MERKSLPWRRKCRLLCFCVNIRHVISSNFSYVLQVSINYQFYILVCFLKLYWGLGVVSYLKKRLKKLIWFKFGCITLSWHQLGIPCLKNKVHASLAWGTCVLKDMFIKFKPCYQVFKLSLVLNIHDTIRKY